VNQQSEAAPVRQVFVAINAITEELSKTGIAKNRRNKDQGYSFRGIDDVYNALAPLLAKHKLVILPEVISREWREAESKKGGKLNFVALLVKYQFVSAVDGSWVTAVATGEGMDSSDKATNKAFSAAYKYVIMQAFAIPIAGTPDADDESPGEQDQTGGGDPENPPRMHSSALVPLPADAIPKLRQRIKDTGSSEAKIIKYFAVEGLDKLSAAQVKELNGWLDDKEKDSAGKGQGA
jgi:hypothetical protein